MLRRIKLAGAVAATVMMGGATFALQAQAQVVDGTTGRVGRCDMFKALGRALPPECGGTGPSTGGATRGRVVIGSPSGGTPKPAAAPAAAPTGPGRGGASCRADDDGSSCGGARPLRRRPRQPRRAAWACRCPSRSIPIS